MKHELKISGVVVHGDGEGRKFGFPTANIEVESSLEAGVYSGQVEFSDKIYKAAVVIHPKKAGKVIEAYIIDFSGDLYGTTISVEVWHKLRNWINFTSLEEAKQQISRDIEQIINYQQIHKNSNNG